MIQRPSEMRMNKANIFNNQIGKLTGGFGGIQYSIIKAMEEANENPTIYGSQPKS
jgi:hypothetical protein